MSVLNKSEMDEKRQTKLPPDEAVRYIRTYFNESQKNPHGRYKSWEHCYNAFIANRKCADERTLDYLALQLAFYLASWGMYRGSSFLLQNDYRVHVPVVRILAEEKYDELVGIAAENLMKEESLQLVEDISTRICRVYSEEKPAVEGKVNKPTDTLVTKILLGTLGCAPAYDRYYRQAVKKYCISSGAYNKKSLGNIAKYYLDNQDTFETVRREFCNSGTIYPSMKLMDMCMWQAAYEETI